jgi:hypothetical protein
VVRWRFMEVDYQVRATNEEIRVDFHALEE